VKKTLAFNLKEAALALGIHEETLAKNMVKSGLAVEPGKKYTLREVFAGYMGGDLKMEQTRKTRAEADAKELENQITQGNIIEREAAEKLIADRLAPIRSKLVAAPTGLASRLNPTDPELAKSVLEDWVGEVLTAASA
jgi:phage terminase Nu1 subunit (DNA packaging protein)